MIFRAEIRDCLVLNWALPRSAAPDPPEALRYDVREGVDGPFVFASTLLCRQSRLELESVPVPWIDAPVAQIHFCTLDEDGVPSVLIRAVMVPRWLAPGAHWVVRQPAKAARMTFPRTVEGATEWRWEVERRGRLVVDGSLQAPYPGSGPEIGSWEETVAYFRRRAVGYFESFGSLRRLELRRSKSDVTPVRAEILEDGLVSSCLTGEASKASASLHSAWLSSAMSVSYESDSAKRVRVGSRVPAPG
jgi:hypothetical protein